MSNSFDKPVFYMKDLVQMFGRHPITIRRWWKSGKFPAPTKPSTLAWRADVIYQWIQENTNGPDI